MFRISRFIIFCLIIYSCDTPKILDTINKQFILSNWVVLEDAQKGQFLDRAQKVSVDSFFGMMMSNPLGQDKTDKPTYEIIYDSSFWIYFGVVTSDNKGEVIVNPFYKVEAEKVRELFPSYLDVDGTNIKAKIYYQYIHDIIETKLKPACNKRYNIEFPNTSYKLTKKGIQVNIDISGYCYDDLVLGAKLNFLMDPSSLEIISEKNSIKEYYKTQEQIDFEKKQEELKRAKLIEKAKSNRDTIK